VKLFLCAELGVCMQAGKFITVEGIEGAGKSSMIQFIAEYLQERQVDFVLTREPGGTEIAEHIRQVLLDYYEEKMAEDTELMLMFAARAQHLHHVIRPALKANKIVICDRFTDTSFAYQGGGRGIDADRIAALETWVQRGLDPDLTILLDVPADIGMERALKRSAPDRIEQEQLHFFERARDAYLARAQSFKDRFRVVDATNDFKVVVAKVKKIINAEVLD
jgi:dTMP kinase